MEKNRLLEVKGLKKHFPVQKGLMRKVVGSVKAVDDVNFHIYEGETFGLVGESGCGKTTLGRCILRAMEPSDGSVLFRSQEREVNMATLDKKELRKVRRDIQMVFQDPYSSLNPRNTVYNIISEPLMNYGIAKGEELRDRVIELIRLVGLDSKHLERYPHAFSGGQRQRISIARALALNPKLIVCDEAVSALDVSVQAQILNLLQDLQERLNLSYLFISHDLGVIRHISNRVGVMYAGKLVEVGKTEELFDNPKHPYTEALLSSRPVPDPRKRKERIILKGEVANPANLPSGCSFHPRCKYAQDICKLKVPELKRTSSGQYASCHFSEEIYQSSGVTSQ
jgi:peptide/nickel transport system ATP-binding protein